MLQSQSTTYFNKITKLSKPRHQAPNEITSKFKKKMNEKYKS